MVNTRIKRKVNGQVVRVESVDKPKRKKRTPRQIEDDLCCTLWSAAVRTRDGYVCQYCGTPTKKAEAHHIFTRSHKSTKFDLANGITLCWPCHKYRAVSGDFAYWEQHTWLGLKKWEALHEKTMEIVKTTDAWYAEQEARLRAEVKRLQDKATE